MDLICAHQLGTGSALHRSLSEAERGVLADHVRGGGCDHQAQNFLQQVWRARLWLACDCRPQWRSPPLLFVRRLGEDQYVLSPMGDRPPHGQGCVFSFSGGPPLPQDKTAASEWVQLLRRWLEAAKLNVILPYQGNDLVHNQFASLRDSSKNLELSRGRRLYDYSRSHPAGLLQLHRRLSAHEVGEASSDRGVYLASVPALSERFLCESLHHSAPELAHLSRALPATVMGTLRQGSPVGGAHLVLFVLSRTSSRTVLEVESAIALPVYSRGHLVPISAPQERATLYCLLEVQRTVLQLHRLVISIRKTMPGSPSFERGIAFQVRLLGPNGQVSRSLDVLSVNCGEVSEGMKEVGPELDWRHIGSFHERTRNSGTLYHVVGHRFEGFVPDQSFSTEVMTWLLGSSALRTDHAVDRRALH